MNESESEAFSVSTEGNDVQDIAALGDGDTCEVYSDICPNLETLGRFACIPCRKSFRDAGNLKRHVESLHEARDELFKCSRSWCVKAFKTLAEQ